MDRLVEETQESIFLGVVSGTDALCVAARESPRSVRLFAEVGRRASLHSGGVPKTLFAFLPDEDRTALLEQFEHDTGEIKIDRQELEDALDRIREQDFAVVADELDVGAHSVAAPIRDHEGDVIAAISIAGPSHRFTDERIERYIELVQEAAGQISRALGFRQLMSSNSHN